MSRIASFNRTANFPYRFAFGRTSDSSARGDGFSPNPNATKADLATLKTSYARRRRAGNNNKSDVDNNEKNKNEKYGTLLYVFAIRRTQTVTGRGAHYCGQTVCRRVRGRVQHTVVTAVSAPAVTTIISGGKGVGAKFPEKPRANGGDVVRRIVVISGVSTVGGGFREFSSPPEDFFVGYSKTLENKILFCRKSIARVNKCT